MKIYVITDTHFGHRFLVEKHHARPDDFEQKIVRNRKNMVGSDDLVIHLGDIVVGKSNVWLSVIPSLPSRKVLVVGTHDKKSVNWYLENVFDFFCSCFLWDILGLKILFSHEPFFDGTFDLNIQGHLNLGEHREHKCDERHYLLSLEATVYQPLMLESIVKLWKKSNSRI